MKGIAIICNLDTRGEDIRFVKDLIASRGLEAIMVDFSMEEPPPFPGDVRTEEVARRGGLPIEVVREKYRSDRDTATNNQIRGASAIVGEMVRAGRVHGVIGIGGGTATLVATSVMKTLPFGMPKVMASPMAAHPAYIDRYVGTRDITMHHTVLDIVKMNPLLRAQIVNAVGAICGMVEMTQGTDIEFDRPCVALSSFGFGEMAVQGAMGMLEESGFIPIVCHAQGKGDRAMEEMIRDGMFHGVIDLCTGGGSLAVIAAHVFPQAAVVGTDVSEEALALAAENGSLHGLDDRIEWLRSDLYESLGTRRFDLVACNPPYVNETSMRALPPEFRAEPRAALAAGRDGMDLVRRIVAGARAHLAADGLLLLEIGHEAAHFEAAFPTLEYHYLPVAAGERVLVLVEASALPSAA
jgi:hypothetical protein